MFLTETLETKQQHVNRTMESDKERIVHSGNENQNVCTGIRQSANLTSARNDLLNKQGM